jgi:uncharacterized protein YgiB involved in biofilm formation
MRQRRSASSLTLVLIGTAALYGCGEETTRRDVYRTRADCLNDWGNDASRCEQAGFGPHAGYYYGPPYGRYARTASGGTSTPRPGSNAIASTNVPRGGFGSSAAAHSSGG